MNFNYLIQLGGPSVISVFHVAFLSIFIPCSCRVALASQVLRPRGVSLEDASKYDPNMNFTCFDGSGVFQFNHVNDDYCDCKDGSDEPGTSACLGVFHCNNNGHIGKDIPSSHVNDGYCDCCDASDEYASDADCLDVCKLMGEVARKEAEIFAEMNKQGYSLCQAMTEQGLQIKQNKLARIEELTAEKANAELARNEKLNAKEVAEAPENEALAKYREIEEEIKERKEKEEKEIKEKEAQEAFAKLDADNDGFISVEDLQSDQIFDTNSDGEVSVDEVKFYFQQEEKVDLDKFISTTWGLMRPVYTRRKPTFTPPVSTESPPEPSEIEDEEEDAEDLHSADYPEDESADPEAETSENVESQNNENEIEYDPETQELMNIASAARDEFNTADGNLRDLLKEIENLKEDIDSDYGPKEEFRVLKESCFEFIDREYIYKLCPFNSATQSPKSGSGETRLGGWGNWAGPPDNPYLVMKYTGGQNCWNGPQRSAEVRLSCGIPNEITAVSEPNRCEYLFLFNTPAVCSPPDSSQATDQHTEL